LLSDCEAMLKKVLTIVGILAAVIGIGVLIGTLASQGPTIQVNTVPEVPETPVTPTHTSPPPEVTTQTQRVKPMARVLTNRIASHASPVQVATPTNLPVLNTNWEATLDQILASDEEDTNKVKLLFAMFPTLPPDGQEEIANHLSNLVEDEDYGQLGTLLNNPKLPEEVLDVLLADLLNRPNTTKLPLFLEVAFTPDHPKAAEARELLELYLDEDYGSDKVTWQKKMQEWLKENPD
jgi:hypothetical protein